MRSIVKRGNTPGLTYRPGRPGVTKLFGELEGEVMEELWRLGSATVRQVHQSLQCGRKDLAYTTIMTVMSRLNLKGFLEREPEGNAFRYRPTASRDAFLAKASLDVFSGLAEDLSGPVMSAFVDNLGSAEAQRLEELAKLIDSKRKKRESGSSS